MGHQQKASSTWFLPRVALVLHTTTLQILIVYSADTDHIYDWTVPLHHFLVLFLQCHAPYVVWRCQRKTSTSTWTYVWMVMRGRQLFASRRFTLLVQMALPAFKSRILIFFTWKFLLFSSQTKRKPMPKLVYNLMSDKDIRKKSSAVGLPTQGDRHVGSYMKKKNTLKVNIYSLVSSPYHTCSPDFTQ